MEQFQVERLWGALNAVGILDNVISGTIEYAGARKAFGRTIHVISSTPEQAGRDVFLTLDHTLQAKVESVLRFLKNGGKRAVITSYEHLCEAVDGNAGTHIIPDPKQVEVAAHSEVHVGGH